MAEALQSTQSRTDAATAPKSPPFSELHPLALDYARCGETESLDLLLQSGLPVDLADSMGNTLLMLASYHGHLDAVVMLLKRGAAVDRKNDRGQTPLGGVLFRRYTGIAELLVAYGADVHAEGSRHFARVTFASNCGETELAQIERGRDVSGDHGGCSESIAWLARFSRLAGRFFRRTRPGERRRNMF